MAERLSSEQLHDLVDAAQTAIDEGRQAECLRLLIDVVRSCIPHSREDVESWRVFR